MEKKELDQLSRRERQMMNIIFQKQQASVQEVLDELPDPPSYSAVRAWLRILEEKGFLKHTKQGAKYVYSPNVSTQHSMRRDLKQLLKTYFSNSLEAAVTALIDVNDSQLEEEDYARLIEIIDNARQEKGAKRAPD
jgi:predicted transcriptional regulator